MIIHEMPFRVAYADTDRMGVVYYANYLMMFERGRTEFLRDHGMCYLEWEEKGYFLPVTESECRYLAPARYDDLLTVRTKVESLGGASVVFTYEIVNAATGQSLVTGRTKHPIVDRSWRPVRIPADMRAALRTLTVG
jgi:acyl-CoA thioester hydrolase